MTENVIILFYLYIELSYPQVVADEQQKLCEKLGLRGRLIVAHEGLNGTFEGARSAIDTYIQTMRADQRFASIHFKQSVSDMPTFPKLSVKVRDEIVSSHLGKKNVDVNPTRVTGKRLTPDELRDWFASGKDFHIVDMRNDYEYKVGHFKNSIASGMTNFRDLPQVPERIAHIKNKPVLTVCTGGVRCEKASGYLVSQGFQDVYQLDGGIVSYMEKFPGQDFRGSLYVFDGRVTMHFDAPDQHVIVGLCVFCNQPCERYVNCKDDECHVHIIACTTCVEKDMGRLCPQCEN